MSVDTSAIIQRCTQWVHGMERGVLRRRSPKACAWSTIAVSIVISTEGDRYLACIAVDVRNTRTGRTEGSVPHTSGWQDTCLEALRALALGVANDALHMGIDIFMGLGVGESSPKARTIYPGTLFGARHAPGES
jgi:hypothetical protein